MCPAAPQPREAEPRAPRRRPEDLGDGWLGGRSESIFVFGAFALRRAGARLSESRLSESRLSESRCPSLVCPSLACPSLACPSLACPSLASPSLASPSLASPSRSNSYLARCGGQERNGNTIKGMLHGQVTRWRIDALTIIWANHSLGRLKPPSTSLTQ